MSVSSETSTLIEYFSSNVLLKIWLLQYCPYLTPGVIEYPVITGLRTACCPACPPSTFNTDHTSPSFHLTYLYASLSLNLRLSFITYLYICSPSGISISISQQLPALTIFLVRTLLLITIIIDISFTSPKASSLNTILT